MDATALILSRLQFAFTISFHIIFPSFTIGLAAWLATLEGLRLATGRQIYRVVFEFWLKIFGVAFGIVEKHLADRQFIIGDRPTIADISMVGYLYYTEETGFDRAPYPNIIGWAKRIAALPGWLPPYDLMRSNPA